ncbi:S8 family serine peptidase [Neolewinella antarctica]|uniref:Subtilisin family serine protease n=1 Tax=Neolewinella antarctica TaxID=442734 RepID=A0ABX0XH22_9BACT|nr:S8 family serine peptidase [Neolewinella antarctica]NJC28083.1 subtilisin family serine protease [Neolewinella antarctica]
MANYFIPSEQGLLSLKKSSKLVGLKRHSEDTELAGVDANIIPSLGGFEVVTLTGEAGVDDALDEVRKGANVEVGTHVYFAEGDNRPVVPTGVLYVEMAEGVGLEERAVLFETFALEILEDREDGTIVCRVTAKSPNPLKVATALTNLSMVIKAYPDLDVPLDQYFSEPRDGLISSQWHLQNEGSLRDVPNFPLKIGADAKVKAAWRRLGNLGNPNIVVAVIDNGFDLRHPDLGGKSVAPLNINNNSNKLPTGARFGDHATPCASVAVAAANGSGLVGAAPLAKLMPLHGLTYSKYLTERMFSHCIRNGADVISCSWGTIDGRYRPDSEHARSVRKALTQGRGGKGCVIVFAAGNEGRNVINYYANIPGVIAVGASTSSDTHASYSNQGPGISVVAPSDGGWPILAARANWDEGNTRQAGIKKYYVDGVDRGPYYKHFGGTSAATPLVAGICALILSANPNLTSVQVKSILESTADKIGNKWDYDARGYSNKYGFGRVNADAAVAEALRLKAGGTSRPTPPPPAPRPPVTPPRRPPAPAPANPPQVNVSGGAGLYRFSVRQQAATGYGLQMSVLAELSNVLKEVESAEKLYGLPVMVSISAVNGRTAFRILLGPFATRAEGLRARSRVQGISGREPWLRGLGGI